MSSLKLVCCTRQKETDIFNQVADRTLFSCRAILATFGESHDENVVRSRLELVNLLSVPGVLWHDNQAARFDPNQSFAVAGEMLLEAFFQRLRQQRELDLQLVSLRRRRHGGGRRRTAEEGAAGRRDAARRTADPTSDLRHWRI